MRAVPYVGARALEPLARRTAVVRVLLAGLLLALVIGAALSVRHPTASQPPLLPPAAGGVVVLDLSASITSDTYSRIHSTLRQLVTRGGRYGLVVFSTSAYEALPPGTPVAAFEPLLRYFSVAPASSPGEQPSFPISPWTNSFTSGTSISQGLDLARSLELKSHTRHPAVVLISDLADDPSDVPVLTQVLADYHAEHIALRVIALNAAPTDAAFFARLVGNASAIIPAQLSAPGRPPASVTASLPVWFIVAGLAVAALLALYELRSSRLRWGGAEATG
jgi:hypothetical protein